MTLKRWMKTAIRIPFFIEDCAFALLLLAQKHADFGDKGYYYNDINWRLNYYKNKHGKDLS